MKAVFIRQTDHQIDQLKSVSKDNLFLLKRLLKASYKEIDRLLGNYNYYL
jgi:hypothetical protein